MKIYSDKALKQEIGRLYDFGIVSAGSTKEYILYVKNDSDAILRALQFFVDHPEVSVVAAPDYMAPGEVGELRLKWSPSVTLKQGLKTQLRVSGEELYKS